MKQGTIKQNFIFQISYQVLIYVIPLIISPYLTRSLGGNALGIYTYSNSIAYYFLLFINLGINRHGQRAIAVSRDDEVELRKTFWGLFSVHTAASIIGVFLYIASCIFFAKEYLTIYLIQTLYVLSAFFDITWLFYGLENFKSIAIKNAFVKVIECVLIFALVRSSKDLWVYTLIMSASILCGQAIMIPQAIKTVKPIKISIDDAKVHIKPLLILFISVVASTVYTVFDKTLLGMMSNNIQDVAYYEYANKIVTIPKMILGVVATVLFPRACKAAADKDIVLQKSIMSNLNLSTAVMGSASVFGLAAIANKFALVYFGEEFAICGPIIFLMSPLILIVYLGDASRTGYLIPEHKDNIYVICNVVSAILNLVVSASLIPFWGIYGAVLGTSIAEVFACAYQMRACRHIFGFKDVMKILSPSLMIGLVMFAVVKFVDVHTSNNVVWLMMEIVIGGAVYILLTAVYLYFCHRNIWNSAVKVVRNKSV